MTNRPRHDRAGLTLVELLVVVAILVLLVAVVLPLAQPALSGRNVREAARQINTIFQRARSEAVANKRPTGIMLIPSSSNLRQSFELAMVRMPLPFAGTDNNWGVTATQTGAVNLGTGPTGDGDTNPEWVLEFRVAGNPLGQGDANFLILKNLVRPSVNPAQDPRGESFLIRFDSKGPAYKGLRVDIAGTTYFVLPTGYNRYVPTPNVQNLAGLGMPFALQREPRRTAAAPLELPVGAYIDLSVSAVEGALAAFDGGGAGLGPIKLVFDANGDLSSIYAGGVVEEIENSVNLLIARGKNASGDDAPAFTNLTATGNSLWISLNRGSGRMMTTENLGFTPPAVSLAAAAAEAVANSVKTGQAMGGR